MPILLKDAQAFEFVTAIGERLPLDGVLKGWSHDVPQDVVTHKILKRRGAVHQVPGTPPRRPQYDCVLLGDSVNQRYNDMEAMISREPFGRLTDPRFGSMPAVCFGFKSKEYPGEQINVIEFSITFEEDALRDLPQLSATGSAQAAAGTAAGLVTTVSLSYYLALLGVSAAPVLAAAQALLTAVQTFQGAVSDLAAAATVSVVLQQGLRTVQLATQTFGAAVGTDPFMYGLISAARLSYGQCIASYNSAVGESATLVLLPVPEGVSLPRWLQSLYGWQARSVEDTVYAVNRIPRPWGMPAGALLVPDPTVILGGAA